MYSFSYLQPVCCSMWSSNCCFLTCIQISEESGLLVWYSHLLQNFPLFTLIHTVKGFGIVSKAEVDVFLELSCFFNDSANVASLISGPSSFSKSILNIGKFTVHVLLNPGLEYFEHYFTRCVRWVQLCNLFLCIYLYCILHPNRNKPWSGTHCKILSSFSFLPSILFSNMQTSF